MEQERAYDDSKSPYRRFMNSQRRMQSNQRGMISSILAI